MAKQSCAPGINYDGINCAKLNVVIEIVKAFNAVAKTNNKIELSSTIETTNPEKYKTYLMNELKKRVGVECSTAKCWSNQHFIHKMDDIAREELLRYTYRPTSPQGRFEWLSNFDIDAIMGQYERKFKNYAFFGAIPMDFEVLRSLPINHIDMDDMLVRKKNKLGVIFNLDNHDQPGSHWVALYIDLAKRDILYFDSYGTMPEFRVRKFMRKFLRHFKSKGYKLHEIHADYNKVRHQRGNSECGVYSVNFLVRVVRGDNFDDICSRVIPDKKINKCRKVYFDTRKFD